MSLSGSNRVIITMIYQELLKRVTDSIVVDFCKLYILLGLSDFFSNIKDLFIVGCLVLWIIILVNYVNTCNVIKLCSDVMLMNYVLM